MGVKRSAKTNSLEPAKKKAKASHATPTVTKSPKGSALKGRKNGAAPARADAEKVHEKASGKRRRPVTVPVDDAGSDAEDEDQGDDDEDEYEGAGDDVSMGQDELDIRGHETTEGPTATKDPNAARESHKAQKELLVQRRASKPHSSLLASAKALWAQARQRDLPSDERQKHVRALMNVIRGHVVEVVMKHDASRIVQTVVKWGGAKERDEIAKELKGRYRELAQSRYSKFLVSKLIRLCPTQRASILREFQGHVPRSLLHREASGVLADAFELHANAYERAILVRDFYGKEAALVASAGVTLGTESAEDKEKAKRGLLGVLEGMSAERRRRVVGSVKEGLITIFNNSDKGAVTHAIVHRVMWEYLCAVKETGDEAEQEKLRRELFDACQDSLAEIVHTRDGSRVVREFLAYGTAKDRKLVVKAIKPHVLRMCTDDEAQLVLFTALDVIDDTKLTGKSIVPEITANISTLHSSAQGRRALLYLLVPRTRRHFTPAQIAALAETDAIREKTSKKDEVARREEVRAAASPDMLSFVAKEGDTAAREPSGALLVGEIMLHADGDKTLATETLLRALAEPYPSPTEDAPHPIDIAHTSRMYKTLLQGGHFDRSTKSVQRQPTSAFDSAAFAHGFAKLGKEHVLAMAEGGGAFVIAELLERLKEEGGEQVREEVQGWFGADVVATLKVREREGAKGVSVLLEKVEAMKAG